RPGAEGDRVVRGSPCTRRDHCCRGGKTCPRAVVPGVGEMITDADGRRPARDHRALRRTASAAASRSIAGGGGLPKIPGQRGGTRDPILAGLPAGPLAPPRTALCPKAKSPLFDSAGQAGERFRSPGIPPAVG